MDNSLFIYTDKNKSLEIERLHVCTWEFNNDTSLVEFGFEVSKQSIKDNQLTISLYMPWFSKDCSIGDLYDKLCIAENSRFIFNDSLSGTDSLDGGRNKLGDINKFSCRNKLSVSVEKPIAQTDTFGFADTQPIAEKPKEPIFATLVRKKSVRLIK